MLRATVGVSLHDNETEGSKARGINSRMGADVGEDKEERYPERYHMQVKALRSGLA